MNPVTTAAVWLAEWAAAAGDDVALIDGRRRRCITAAQLAERVAAMAQRLRDSGVGEGDRVALCSDDELTNVIAFVAAGAVGAAALPIHRRLTPTERSALLVHGAPRVAIYDDGITKVDASARRWDAPGADAALLLFTSGTTGTPRLAELRWAAVQAATRAALALPGLNPARWLACLPMSHVGGLSIVLRCLCARTTVVLTPFDSPDQLGDDARTYDVTAASLVPTQLHRLVQAGVAGPPSLSLTLVGGAACSDALAAGAARLGWAPRRTYGLTEACSQVTTARAADDPASGVPLAGVDVWLEDIGPDGVGEVWIGGPTRFAGYRRPDGTLEPAGERWATGDLGRWVSSSLEIVTRRSDLVVTGGENVYPAEVEAALVRLGLGTSAVVFGLPDAEWGQVVCAALVDPQVDRERLARLRGALGGFKRPRRWFEVAALPLTASQKVQRQEVKRLCAAGAAPERTREWVDE